MMNRYRDRPNWVDEEPLIQSLLHRFIDQVDKGVKTQFRVTQKNTPELFDYNQDDPTYLWELIQSLDNEYHVITVKKQKVAAGHDLFENAQIYFNPDKESLVRDWLNRPALDAYTLVWTRRLEKIRDCFEDGGVALEDPIRVEGKGADEVINGFVQLHKHIQHSQTLRNLSSKCFWGHSKFLDQRFELLRSLFPQASQNIIPRPLMVNVYLPERCDTVIFIENQDSYLSFKQAIKKNHRFINTGLVYAEGFKASSGNIRKRDYVSFSYLHGDSTNNKKEFESWWFKQSKTELNAHFWGDLDFSGMAIVAALRKNFPELSAWAPGYNAMLEYYREGIGHSFKDANKGKQKDPEETGCDFCDLELLPAMRNTRRFLDQEVISQYELENL